MLFSLQKNEWFGNLRVDFLSGLVVAFALIPEAIGFSIIAGVDPMIGLYASFTMAVVIAFIGGRPAMISAATGAMALLVVDLVKNHGLQYLLAATILTGIFQLLFGYLGIAKLMRFIPRSVMVGFVNALAILIFTAQLTQFQHANWMMYAMVGVSLLILYGLPKFFKAIPAALIAIIVMTVISISLHLDLKTVGDMGNISSTLPVFLIPSIPFNLETLQIILPTALGLSIVGLLESLLTASIVDDMTNTDSDKTREAKGQGIANIVTGFFGGMAGCAMIGQSVINVSAGGRKRFSTLVAGIFLMVLIIVLGNWVVQIPMAVLVAIMIMVSIGTFDWRSFEYIRKGHFTDTAVMIVTVVIVVFTHNLAIGVITGVILSAILFMVKISKIHVKSEIKPEKIIYKAKGQLFFASVDNFTKAMAVTVENKRVLFDLSELHIWDDSGVEAIYKVIQQFENAGNSVRMIGLNKESRRMMRQLKSYLKNSSH
ncbi:SulP family inorganic anion transporter [Listeria booriae]|uniref:SulP family inorganic anion transporter n=1 Tax=Listeria booriae TaxID=1552123 RepID=A0A7X0ZLD4_9LIST|nr:SulP family inorganic anion transporter [Listeria booriae]MBC2285609.1 SulP family inorganic anion transporter [Listeria booriae]MBC2294710.1 SulP family inorganic anion transporter [Listeria booriae]MBC2303846.1 SulP family inorganic anion transporter [Listeria booriae]